MIRVFSYLVEYKYCCHIEPFIYLVWANIGWFMLISISHDSDSVYWWSQNSRSMALAPKFSRTYTIFWSHIMEYGHRYPIQPLVSFYLWNWSSYTNFYFLWFRFSTLVITKYKKYGASSINMNNCHNCFSILGCVDIVVPYLVWYFYVVLLIQIHQFSIIVTQI